jgi:hypothetical protein
MVGFTLDKNILDEDMMKIYGLNLITMTLKKKQAEILWSEQPIHGLKLGIVIYLELKLTMLQTLVM